MLWSVLLLHTSSLHTSSSQKSSETTRWRYNPRNSFTSLGLFKFGAQIPCWIWQCIFIYEQSSLEKFPISYPRPVTVYIACIVYINITSLIVYTLFTCLTVTVSLKQQHLYHNNYYSACMKNKTAVQIIITVCMKNKTACSIRSTVHENKTAVKDNESLFMDLYTA